MESIEELVRSWGADGITASDINNGLCADFANALVVRIPGAEVYGVYDVEDIEVCPGEHSPAFRAAVRRGDVGHTAIFNNGLFFDSEAISGVARFEDLPVNQRASSD